MIVISDTNILSSLAAGNAFSSLLQLFARLAQVEQLVIPPDRQAAIFAINRRR